MIFAALAAVENIVENLGATPKAVFVRIPAKNAGVVEVILIRHLFADTYSAPQGALRIRVGSATGVVRGGRANKFCTIMGQHLTAVHVARDLLVAAWNKEILK